MTNGRVVIDREMTTGRVDDRLCGSFVEHLGRTVYGGIYDPGDPASDGVGFRRDVLALVKELGVNLVRYPGGNFVSAYDWRDGVGPRPGRPRKRDAAWKAIETNEFGLAEFVSWCGAAAVEPFLVFNLGTADIESACQLVEYCNTAAGTVWADLRRQHGQEVPFDIRLWGLGNEMDGTWQIGSLDAAAYGAKASRVARAVKRIDPKVELVAAGSSLHEMPSFPAWDRTVLEQCYDDVDYLALHQYYPADVVDEQSFLASGHDFDQYLRAGIATCDYVRASKRSARRMSLAIDEWNVNYRHDADAPEPWSERPRIGEHEYTALDAVVEADLFLTILRHADRARIACQSLLVNVGGPIRAEAGQPASKQALFEPLALMFGAARGSVVHPAAVTGPEVATDSYGDAPALEAVALSGAEGGPNGEVVVFAVNRDLARSLDLEVELRGWDEVSGPTARALVGSKSADAGFQAVPWQPGEGRVNLALPPASLLALSFDVPGPERRGS